MAGPRVFTDVQLVAMRFEYERTCITERALAAKYGLPRSTVKEWAIKQKWRRSSKPRDYAGEAGEQQLARDIRTAIKQAYDQKIVEALEVGLDPTRGPKADQPDPNPGRLAPVLLADRPDTLPRPAAPEAGKPTSKDKPEAKVVRFPGRGAAPPPSPEASTSPFPARSHTEAAAMRVKLSQLRGELALQQVQQLSEHTELLGDYQHLIHVGINPSRFVDISELTAEEAKAKLDALSREALRIALPTERDTLSNAVLACNKALLAAQQASRTAIGTTSRQLNGQGAVTDEAPGAAGLDVAALRQVQQSMQLLKGDLQRVNEPPRPPPPDTLEDLRGDPPPGP